MATRLSLLLATAAVAACSGAPTASGTGHEESHVETTSEVVLASDVEWGPLNPARGDASPVAGTLWGDRAGAGASGFLVRFADGFSSPPHVHNVSYRGMVISGLIHNDDPNADEMWLPAGSFWTQPAGEAHVTAAAGSLNVAYIEIEEGPYLVRPVEEAFDNGERSVNVDRSNFVWLDTSDLASLGWLGTSSRFDPPKIAFLWGSPQDGRLNGTLVKLPEGFDGELRTDGATLRAVSISGQLDHQTAGEAVTRRLEPGSYFSSNRGAAPRISCRGGGECIIYVRAEGRFVVEQAAERGDDAR